MWEWGRWRALWTGVSGPLHYWHLGCRILWGMCVWGGEVRGHAVHCRQHPQPYPLEARSTPRDNKKCPNPWLGTTALAVPGAGLANG